MKLLKTTLCLTLFFLMGLQLQAQDEYNLDETYSIAKKGAIHLASDDAEVSITGSDRSDVHLVVYRHVDIDGWNIGSKGDFKMDVDERSGDLYIKEKNTEHNRLIMGSVKEEYRITLEVPHEVALMLEGDDETYDISGANGAIHISADDSEIKLGEVSGKEFTFDVDDGSIRMDEGYGRLKLNMDDGSFYVRHAEFSDVDAEFDDGDLELNISGGGGEFDIHHDDPHINAGSNFEKLESDDERSVYRLAGGNARIEIDTDDGDIELRTI